MRRVLLAVSFWLLAIGFVNAQEAFYIYRNDGDFNGFFYDEVVEMRQSKIGVDSVEYNQWVTQEVVLADTTYRIPLSAIDSISFIQPEIIFNPQLRHMDLLGMTPYIITRSDQTLIFSNELPISLMPQIGNVLIGFTGILEEGGFGGCVKSVTSSGGSIIVETEELTKMSDIFIQFITIEEVGVLDDNPNQVVSRMAGINKIKQWQGGINISLFNLNAGLHIPIDTESGNGGGSIDVSLSFRCKLAMVYKIDKDIFFVKAGASQELSLQPSMTLKVSGTGGGADEMIKPAISFKFPATPPIPLFQVDPMPKIGSRWGGEFSMKISFPSVSGKLSEVFTFDSESPDLVNFSMTPQFNPPAMSNLIEFLDNTDFEFKAEGYVQLGGMMEFAIKTNQWVSKIISASCGIDVWQGPKATLSFNINGKSLLAGDGPYTFADNFVGFSALSLDAEAYTKASFMGKPVNHTWGDGSIDVFGRQDFYFLNKFSNYKMDYNKDSHILRASWDMDIRSTLYPHRPGIAVYHKRNATPKIIYSDYTDLPIKVSEDDAISQHFDIEKRTVDWKAGQYFAAPSLNTSDGEHPVYSLEQSFYVPVYAKADKDKVTIPAAGGSADVKVSTNGVVNIPPQNDPKISVTKKSDSIVTISVAEPNTLFLDTAHFQPVTISIVDDPEDVTSSADISVEVAQAYDSHIFNHIEIGIAGQIISTQCNIVDSGDVLHISGGDNSSREVSFMGGSLGIYPLVDFEFSVEDPELINNTPAHETHTWSFIVTIDKETKHVTASGSSNISTTYSCSGVSYNLHHNTSYSFEGECGNDGHVTITSGSGKTDAWGSMSWPSYGEAPAGSTSNSVTDHYGVNECRLDLKP
jgi:hypothetical protein